MMWFGKYKSRYENIKFFSIEVIRKYIKTFILTWVRYQKTSFKQRLEKVRKKEKLIWGTRAKYVWAPKLAATGRLLWWLLANMLMVYIAPLLEEIKGLRRTSKRSYVLCVIVA